ncbi:tRNA threonylcarbamoyladenosine biosynthesis protein TsaB [Helicobacter cappadocius]|uniref:tRNA threonylcarbamoyladenosine biosynthesis protein TsaB n=1 Tax=Helicobacter cappadocius TaxID=3063998 RepID=A0AA90PJ89_9HELI|nr:MULTISPECIES: tRNA threonylcarbamoyladenosine biosynthesis protein TsaB [unclassified Helicobacter]MDO7253303.1 tRNA threonylcarbamoyladenosine biosynthesis protein TsaB [Helicobacter sp. faydin-H75]MDP2539267.1 tRNA threonylcarbamoyladenosine biosynthesis protein TsaB [Helicobacter sp. faydin-H76]
MSDLKKADLILIGVSSPMICGVYENFHLKKSFSSTARSADAILEVFNLAFEYLEIFNMELRSIFYAKGPGSFTSLKLVHIFLQTLCLDRNIKLYSVDSFYFNHKSPIKAFGNKYFIKNTSDDIHVQETDEKIDNVFSLPFILEPKHFDTQNIPLYILPPL